MAAFLAHLYYQHWLPRKYGGAFARRLAWFQANESRSPAEIAAWRRERLQSLVRHAAQQVPHYRQAFRRAGISPEEMVDEAAFSRLPLLRRSHLDDHLDDLVAENTPRAELTASTTGGSTGAPVKYYHDAEYQRQEAAMILRNRLWTGWRYGEAVMRFWGSPLDVRARTRLQSSLDMLLRNESMVDAYRMDASRLAGWPRRIQRGRPPLVEGYANVLVALVEACQGAGVALDKLGIKAVISTAEVLYPTQRSRLEEAFGCRVFNRYGSREVSTLAHECRFGRLHTIDDWVYVEIVDEDGQPVPEGEVGLVAVTSFYNSGMPLIRYIIEDLAALSPSEGIATVCPCGLPFRTLERLEGRVGGLVALPGGGYANADLFLHIFRQQPVRQFQVIQPTLNRLDIYLAPGDGFGDENLKSIQNKLRHNAPGLAVTIHLVEQVSPLPSGKHRFIISHISAAGRR